MKTTWTVSELNRAVATAVAGVMGGLGQIQVSGELSEVSVTRTKLGSPMVFFVLKEGNECLSCTSFGRALEFMLTHNVMTGEVFNPPRRIDEVLTESRRVVCRGKLVTYARNGRSLYQLMAFSVTEVGLGEELRRLRELKARLARQGYFEPTRKRPLPDNPNRVALITARGGAAIHDFLKTAQDRGLGALISLYSVRVQGERAAVEVAAALRQAAQDGHEVIVLTRGGGSSDDLSSFNDEGVARAIFESPVPVLAGIGHEVAVCIAEMVADARASTPTMAATMLWKPRSEMAAALAQWNQRLRGAFAGQLERHGDRLRGAARMLALVSPQRRATQLQTEIDDLTARLRAALARMAGIWDAELFGYGSRAQRALLKRAEMDDARLGHLAQRLAPAARSLTDARGRDLDALATRLRRTQGDFVAGRARALREKVRDLSSMTRFLLSSHEETLERLRLRLLAVDPKRPLERGFALLRDGSGAIVRGVAALSPGQRLGVELVDGRAEVRVEAVTLDGVPAALGEGIPQAPSRAGSGSSVAD